MVNYIIEKRKEFEEPHYVLRMLLVKSRLEFPYLATVMPQSMRVYNLLFDQFTDISPPQNHEYLQANLSLSKSSDETFEVVLQKNRRDLGSREEQDLLERKDL